MAANEKGDVPVKTGATTDTSTATQKGGKGGEEFKRTFTIPDMVIWGLICMVPISPMAIYGGVFIDSNGMPSLAFIIGFVAVLFSVFSFGIMIQRFQSSGSIFTYVSNIMGKFMGFIAGWLMLLQYLVSPALLYLIAAIAINSMFPEVPILVLCLGFLVIVGIVSVIGMKTAVLVNKIALIAQLVILALFVGFGVVFIATHPETSSFSPTNIFDPSKFTFDGTMSAVSLAVLSYVGFGAIATLTQEAIDPKRGPSRAMLIMVIILCVLYVAQCYIATCIDPTGANFANNSDNAFYIVARMAAGPWLAILCALGVALSQGIFTAMAQQTSIAFVMYTMAKDGVLPKCMAKMNKRTNSPMNAIVFIIALSAVLIVVFQLSGINMNTVAKITNFGALATYALLNLSVIIYCWFQLKERKGIGNLFMHLIFPAIGTVICIAIMLSVQEVALTVGAAWIVVGIIYYCILKFVLHREITLGGTPSA